MRRENYSLLGVNIINITQAKIWQKAHSNRGGSIYVYFSDITETHHTGETVQIKCSYPENHEHNEKFLCKGETPVDCKKLIQTKGQDRHGSEGRFAIRDNQRVKYFYVTIKNVNTDDSGTYWCGSDTSQRAKSRKILLSVGEYTERFTVILTQIHLIHFIYFSKRKPVLPLMHRCTATYYCSTRKKGAFLSQQLPNCAKHKTWMIRLPSRSKAAIRKCMYNFEILVLNVFPFPDFEATKQTISLHSFSHVILCKTTCSIIKHISCGYNGNGKCGSILILSEILQSAAVYLFPVQPGNQGRGWWTLLLQKQSTTQQIKNGV